MQGSQGGMLRASRAHSLQQAQAHILELRQACGMVGGRHIDFGTQVS